MLGKFTSSCQKASCTGTFVWPKVLRTLTDWFDKQPKNKHNLQFSTKPPHPRLHSLKTFNSIRGWRKACEENSHCNAPIVTDVCKTNCGLQTDEKRNFSKRESITCGNMLRMPPTGQDSWMKCTCRGILISIEVAALIQGAVPAVGVHSIKLELYLIEWQGVHWFIVFNLNRNWFELR